MTALLEVRDVVKHFPLRKGMFAKPDMVHALDGVSLSVGAGRAGRARRRIGQRQDHAGTLHPRPGHGHVGSIVLDGQDVTHSRGSELRASAGACSRSSRTPTPRSTHAGRSRTTVREPLDAYGIGTPDGARRARRGAARSGRPARAHGRPTTARALGWPAPTRRHRRGTGARARPHRGRRAGLRAGRVGAGADPQPARGAQPRPGHRHRAHHPQPRGGRAHLRSRHRAVPGPHRRGRAGRDAVRATPSTPTRGHSWRPSPTPTRRAA